MQSAHCEHVGLRTKCSMDFYHADTCEWTSAESRGTAEPTELTLRVRSGKGLYKEWEMRDHRH